MSVASVQSVDKYVEAQKALTADSASTSDSVDTEIGGVDDSNASSDTSAEQAGGEETADTADSDSASADSDSTGGSSSSGNSSSSGSGSSGSVKTTAKANGSVPSSKAEIINYCNTALNNAKAAKVGYTKTFVRKGGDNLPSVVAKVIAQNKTTTAKKGSDDIIDDFPAGGFSWSSKLRESDCESATLTQSGNYYDILIKIKPEKNPGKGEASSHGRVMTVIDAEEAGKMVPGIKSINMSYHNGYVKARVDSKTGKLVSAEFSAAADIEASIAVLGDLKADNLVSTESFSNIVW